ncbi:MAG: D-tyrosyl-tRNA(Tyr) deacylase [Actinobacteria bacterium]|nr:D-tyrosyl-tRNA(Tyr) deacylase [Actinomycetota bacterium]
MRAVLQRVSRASVSVDGAVVGAIGTGFVVLLGVAGGDSAADVEALVAKVAGLRVFPDDDGKMNRSLVEADGAVLLISQFTLLADVRKGRRPSFTGAADPADAARLVDEAAAGFEAAGIEVETGRFGAHMDVDLCNDGPVTIVVDTAGGRVV